LPGSHGRALGPSFDSFGPAGHKGEGFFASFFPKKKKISRKAPGLEQEFARKAPLPSLELLIQWHWA
jgi:hypothetical protein